MICPKCGEVNSSNFLFCGMCGTILEPARRATAAVPPPPPARAPESHPVASAPVTPPVASPPRPPVAHRVTVSEPVPSISGPSLLGLDQRNSVDTLRDRAFSGLASYGRPEETRGGKKGVLLTIVLVAALAWASWWTYKNYIGVATTRKAAVTAPVGEAMNPPPENPVPTQVEKLVEKNDAKVAPAPSEHTPEDASATPATKPSMDSSTTPETKKAAETGADSTPKPVTPAPIPARHEVSATRIPATKPAPPAVDSGDALFRRGQTYLYGRNGTEDCGNALKYLKMAADMQHAKARSMMGTMYATGHCVPRDLPSSYRWFALALRVDPNNSILEKDLSAVWNQMTPPERQMATKSQ